MQMAGAAIIGLVLFGMIMGSGRMLGYKLAAFLWGTTAVVTGLIVLGAMMMAGMFGE